VPGEEARVRLVLVEVVRREHHRQHRHVRLQPDPHQPVDHGRGDELVTALATAVEAMLARALADRPAPVAG
jgi:hypothetical protein